MDYDLRSAQKGLLTLDPTRTGLRIDDGIRPTAADFSLGIEEEYFLVDEQTYEVVPVTPDPMFARAKAWTNGQAGREFLQAQIEVTTAPQTSVAEARSELMALRQVVAQAAHQHGLAILAAGTHPTARWLDSVQTPKARYDDVMDTLQMIGQRNMLCGMHVHVSLPDPTQRVDVMARITPWLPLMLALSTSSPFWQSRCTGLKGYRLAAYDELPRTGLPELFKTNADYEAYIQALVLSGVMEDSSHVWWAIRPSLKYPTLELRAPDCCTRVADTVAIAALYRVLIRHLFYNPGVHADLGVVGRAIAVENKWRAQRYGVQGSFATEAGAVGVRDMLEQVIRQTAADAAALACEEEVAHCRQIVAKGTSADAQLAVYEAQSAAGHATALRAVTEWIAATTLHGDVEQEVDTCAAGSHIAATRSHSSTMSRSPSTR
jgi:glutamate---cysteine ligase / carboxylate-amine ligase